MTQVWENFTITGGGGCTCCGGAPGECACALLIPPINSTFADYDTAAAAIANNTANCFMYWTAGGDTPGAAAASFSGNAISASANVGNSMPTLAVSTELWFSLSAIAGTLSVGFTNNGDGDTSVSEITLWDCATAFAIEEAESNNASGSLTVNLNSNGTYYLSFLGSQSTDGNSLPTAINVSLNITHSADFLPNPIVANYTDSNITRQLEACPKMVIPAPEWDGSWYINCDSPAGASNAIATLTFDCYGYTETVILDLAYYSFSGTRATYTQPSTSGDSVGVDYTFFSVNLVGGDTATITVSASCETVCEGSVIDEQAQVTIEIYSVDGTLIDSATSSVASSSTSASSSFTVPYTGKYIVRFIGSATQVYDGDCLEPTASGSVYGECTSDGDISANEIQALYDVGLDCPGRLACGDSCP